MNDLSLRKTRLALAGGLAVVLTVGGAGFVIGRGTSARDAEPAAGAPAAPARPVAIAPATQPSPRDPIRTRADLIALAAQAADAFAAGQRMPDSVADAAGQRFQIRVPFGCQGPSEPGSDAPMRWRYDEQASALRLHVAPVAWTLADLVATPAPADAEAVVEGFWLSRPWTSSEVCPAAQESPVPTGADAVTLPGQTLAVVQPAQGEGAGQERRETKPFETVVRISPEDLQADRGFQFRISGRIASLAGHGPVSCRQPAGAEQRPICVIAIAMDDVTIDNPVTGKTLATWNVAAAGRAGR